MVDLLVLLAVPVIFVTAMRRLDRAVLLWLVLSPLQHDTDFFGHDLRVISFDRLALFATVGALFATGQFHSIIAGPFSKFEKTVFWFIGLFILDGVLVFPPRDAFSLGTTAFDLFIVPLFLYLLTKHLLIRDGEYNLRFEANLALTLGIVAVYGSAMAIFENRTGIDLLPRSENGLMIGGNSLRANGPFELPEILGEYLSFTALFLIYRWKAFPVNPATGRKISKLVTIPVSLISLAGIYTTMFRNIWGGFVGGYALRHLMTRKGRIFLFVATISGLIGFSVFSSQITSSSVYQERLTNVENIHDRLNAWLYAFRAFSEHPLLGIGYGQLKHYIRGAQARGDDLRIYEEVAATYHPHNTVIGMLGENGIIITLLFLLILWRFLPYVRNALRQAYLPEDKEFGLFALSATFALLAPHMTDRCLQWTKYNNLLFLFFALVVARSTEISRRAEEPNSIIDSSEIDSESEPNPLTIEHVS